MKADPQVIELDEGDLYAKLDRIEAALGADIAKPFRQLLGAYIKVLGVLRDKTLSIQRLRKLIFGGSSERSSKILPETKGSADSSSEPGVEGSADASTQGEAAGGESTARPDADSKSDDAASSKPPAGSKPGARRRGHGRNPASAYTGCPRVLVTHGSLCAGDTCPCCGQGTVYRQPKWSAVVRLKGQAPVGGTVYELERLRCHVCGQFQTAELPEEAGPEKYDPTVASTIGTLRYGEGLPWHRIERIQRSAGVPLAASNQWELVRDAIPGGIQAAYDHLLDLGAQGELMHNDDTPMRVLELSEKIKNQQPLLDEAPERRGVFTSNILSRNQGRPPIALFFTGPHHAGENLRDVLARRRQELPPPIQMCDPLCAPDVSGYFLQRKDPEYLVGNVVRPWPFGRPPWLGVTLMKCVIHRQDSYPDNVGHWRCSVALAVLLAKESAWLRKESANTFGKSQSHSRQYQSRPEIDAGIGKVLNGRKR